MHLASFVANQCLAYLLQTSSDPLRQPQSGRKTPLYPPWSSAVESFRSLCTGCGACTAVCPNQLLALNEDGLPVVDFSESGCTFCGACARTCPTEALVFDPGTPPWDLRAVINETCLLANRVLCRTCSEHCPQAAIAFSLHEAQVPEIIADQCDGCGACYGVCPVKAISFAHLEA